MKTLRVFNRSYPLRGLAIRPAVSTPGGAPFGGTAKRYFE
jgi:hypothetical protein